MADKIKATVKYETKKPTGLSIARNGDKFTISWKIGDSDYGQGQMVQYEATVIRINNGTSSKSTYSGDLFLENKNLVIPGTKYLGAKATSYTVTIDSSEFYPTKSVYLSSVTFKVAGRRSNFKEEPKSGVFANHILTNDCVYSEFATKTYTVKIPKNIKTLTAALSNTANRTRFSWEIDSDSSMTEWYKQYEWQSILLKNSTITKGDDVKFNSSASSYQSGTGTALTGDKYIVEDDASSTAGWKTTNTYTRWLRMRGKGPRGNSAKWKYAKHIYARPNAAKKLSGKLTMKQAGMQIYMNWTLDAPANRPVDSVMVQYLKAVPNGMTPPSEGWTDNPVGEITDTSKDDGLTFMVESTPGLDECVWARVKTTHDADSNYSDAYLLRTEKLKAPTNVSVTTNATTHQATVHAENQSTNEGSRMIVRYVDKTYHPVGNWYIAQIPHGQSEVTFQCPGEWDLSKVSFIVYAVVAKSITSKTYSMGGKTVTLLDVDPFAISAGTSTGNVPMMPSSITLNTTDIDGTVNVKWSWVSGFTYEHIELSWADHEDAWRSTSGPSTYVVDRIESPSWNISGLDSSKIWYVRARFGNVVNDSEIWGPYSDIASIDMSPPPAAPQLYLSSGVVKPKGSVKASWTYYSENGSAQKGANIYQVITNNGTTTYKSIYHNASQQTRVIYPNKLGWTAGNTYTLVLRVTSDSGKSSDYSDPVDLVVASPVSISITNDSFEHNVQTEDLRTITALTEMPLNLTVTGAGESGTTTVSITRSEDYHLSRPDETEFDGYDGETIVSISQAGQAQIVINNEDLIGYLDDGAKYRLTATVIDDYGQTASQNIDFEVHWSHQALKPEATADIDVVNDVAILKPVAPTGAIDTDVCDIYRLSSDRPVLIYRDAKFGTVYVDPYPTIGEAGGYRFVLRTANNDYITEDNEIAWYDEQLVYETLNNIINFGNDEVELMYNVSLSSNWSKDFKEQKYLGGSVEGDWNAAVSRTGSIQGVIVTLTDQRTIEKMRRLAVYPGICRVRTVDGSNYTADVQVSESRGYEPTDLITSFSLNVTRVDPVTTDGLTYSEWADFYEDVLRTYAIKHVSDGGDLEYTITYSVYSTETQTTLLITKIKAEGSTTDGTPTFKIVADSTQLYSAANISGEIEVSLTKTWNRDDDILVKDLNLIISINNSGTVTEETNTTYINILPLET